jgi:Flp pilus assembly protein CpaB
MRRGGRTLILIGLLLAVGAVALAIVLGQRPAAPKPTPTPTPEGVKIVVAVQSIPRGGRILTGQVEMVDWPSSRVPPNALTDPDVAVGKFAKQDIARGIPILPGMIAASPAEAAAAGGSAAALAIQTGRVGVAFPLRSTYPDQANLPFDRRDKDVLPRLLSVAYAIQPGDRVDVLACFWVYELDKEFQSRIPNKIGYIDPEKKGQPVEGMGGRPIVAPGGAPGVEGPSEPQLPRMVCQWTAQNARVLGLGDWVVAAPPTPPPAPGGGQPTPTPLPPLPQIVTLEVDPQDALVLKYARETGAQIDLVLRSPNDKDKFSTEAVTLQYMFERFRVAVPPKLDYGIGGAGGQPVGATAP